MVPRKLPSSCGLPSCWNNDMELRLGYLEAQDEMRDLRDMVKILKREFPDLGDYVLTIETLLQWVQWLDWQEGPRSDSYRAGITAGHLVAQESLYAKGLELGPMSIDNYMVPQSATSSGAQANIGVRLVDNDDGSDIVARTVDGGPEPVYQTTLRSKETPGRIYRASSRARSSNAQIMPTTPSGSGSHNHRPYAPNSKVLNSGTTTSEDINLITYRGKSSSTSRSYSPTTQPTRSSTTSASLHVLETPSRYSYPSTPTTPVSAIYQTRSVSNNSGQDPQRSKSARIHNVATFTRLASSGSVLETPSKFKATPTGNASLSSGSGLLKRRQLGELNVGVETPSHLVEALPQIGGKEDEQSAVTPVNSLPDSVTLRARMKAKMAGK